MTYYKPASSPQLLAKRFPKERSIRRHDAVGFPGSGLEALPTTRRASWEELLKRSCSECHANHRSISQLHREAPQ